MLSMKNISKAFFGVNVLDNVNFTVGDGETHALLGENGAGKSTLMNILAGVHHKDSGTIEFDGKIYDSMTVKKSEGAGIAFVHQELNLFNDLKVYENIFLRKEITRGPVLNKKAMIQKTRELFSSFDVDIDPNALVSELETSKKQLLEIAKALFGNAKLLILDEPTTALNNSEIEHLFSIVNKLKGQGKSFIFISHKMNEIFDIADKYTVLRNGKFIANGNVSEITPTDITKLMVGNSYSDKELYTSRKLGEPIIEMKNLSGNGYNNITLSINRGEIIGLTGLKGAGIRELLNTIFGAEHFKSGILRISGKTVKHNNSIHKAMKNKLAMIPSNRKENSIIPDFTILENNYISEHTLTAAKPIISKRREIQKYNELRDILNIKANSYNDLITSLSGGNQQKIILARWLNTKADIILMDNPTQGIDVGAKAEIYKLILELAAGGKTVLVNTLEIPEIQKIADRCIVFFHGEIKKILERNEITEHEVMLYATGAIETTEVS